MQKLTQGFAEIYDIENAMTSQTLYDVISLLVNANHNKPLGQFLHLNALYPLTFVPLKKYVSSLSFRSVCF